MIRALVALTLLTALAVGAWALRSFDAFRRSPAFPEALPDCAALPWHGTLTHTSSCRLDDGTIEVQVGRGAGWVSVARNVMRRDDIPWQLQLWQNHQRGGSCLMAGRFRFASVPTVEQLVERLCKPGDADTVRVTIPEGWSVHQIADLLVEHKVLANPQDFLAVAWVHPAQTGRSSEGRLFPDTYEFVRGADPARILQRMRDRFDQRVGPLLDEHAAELERLDRELQLDLDAVITLASLVEKETAEPSERPRIAQVFLNRLARGMPLQTDPTCVYDPARRHRKPNPADCRDPTNLWSTYVLPRLPPTPIANPGRDAVQAVLRPSGETDLLYFCAMQDGTGRHAFARTLDEHNRNVRRYLRRDRPAAP